MTRHTRVWRLVAVVAFCSIADVSLGIGCGGALSHSPDSGLAPGDAAVAVDVTAVPWSDAGDASLRDATAGDGPLGDATPSPVVGCPAGLTCDVVCADGGTTTISGAVYDPAGRRPVYDVMVYVPRTPLLPLPRGVLTGADACSCVPLFQSGPVTIASSSIDGTFKLQDAPVGPDVPLVLQLGKWRRVVHVAVAGCQDNPLPDRSLTLPGTVAPDTDDNMPDFAVSTGSADSLECILARTGVSPTEYVAGASAAGHVHLFSGGRANVDAGDDTGIGLAESPGLAGAPASRVDLWANPSQLMPYDLTLLSCEGGETYDANPSALEAYLNAGGRVLASHYHYAWFSGPLASRQGYLPPSDWGSNVAMWTASSGEPVTSPIGGVVVSMLNGLGRPFPKGVAMQEWLMNTGALGQGGVPPGDVLIADPQYNAIVSPSNWQTQPWIATDGDAGQTLALSFDTPLMDGGPPLSWPVYCGRALYTDLHSGGSPSSAALPPPASCSNGELSAQEDALEFLLFTLTDCPTMVVGAPVPPPPGD